MQTLAKMKIEKKLHSFEETIWALLRKCARSGEILSQAQAQAKKIARYAPKYVESIQVQNWTDPKLVRTLKRIKKVRSIQDDSQDSSGNQWRLALQNKFKSIQVYKPKQDEWKFIEKYRAFPNLTKMQLYDCDEEKATAKKGSRSASFFWRALRYVPGMVNLKSLSLDIDSETYPGVLKRLDSMLIVLSSLEKIKIHWVQRKGRKQKISFSSLAENKNTLKSLTHLSLNGVTGDSFSDCFEFLSMSCKGLTNLSLNYSRDDADLKFLRSLKNFLQLKKIQIAARNVFSFIDNFTLPPSIINVHISLEGSSWDDISQELILLEDDKRFANFSKEWSHLSNLDSLWISVEHAPGELSSIFTFVTLILKSIPTLANFFLVENVKNSETQEADSIDLTDIFRALQRFSKQLKAVWLAICCQYSLDWPSSQDNTFPKLTQFMLPLGIVSSVSTIQNLFNALKRPVSQGIVHIALGRFIVDSNQTLLDLLQVLRKSPRNSDIELLIEIETLDFESFGDMFKEFIKNVKKTPVVQSVPILSIQIAGPYYDRGVEVLDFLKGMFQFVKFSRKFQEQEEESYEDENEDEEFEEDYEGEADDGAELNNEDN